MEGLQIQNVVELHHLMSASLWAKLMSFSQLTEIHLENIRPQGQMDSSIEEPVFSINLKKLTLRNYQYPFRRSFETLGQLVYLDLSNNRHLYQGHAYDHSKPSLKIPASLRSLHMDDCSLEDIPLLGNAARLHRFSIKNNPLEKWTRPLAHYLEVSEMKSVQTDFEPYKHWKAHQTQAEIEQMREIVTFGINLLGEGRRLNRRSRRA